MANWFRHFLRAGIFTGYDNQFRSHIADHFLRLARIYWLITFSKGKLFSVKSHSPSQDFFA